MSQKRILAVAGIVGSALALAACGGSPRAATGVLTGTLERCTLHVQPRTVEVIGTNAMVVATERVTEGSGYRFVLPPGRYFISAGGSLDTAQPDVLQKAEQTVHQNFPLYACY